MKSDDGTLRFGTAIDMTGFNEGINQIEGKVSGMGAKVQQQSARISELMNNVPSIKLDVITNASQSLSTIKSAYDEIDHVVDMNKSGIKELEAEYNRLGVLANAAFQKGTSSGDKEYKQLQNTRDLIQKVVAERMKVISAAEEQADAVNKIEQQLQKEAQAATKADSSHQSFRTQLMQAKNEMRQLVLQGKQNTDEYEAVRQKVVQLTQSMNIANKQTKAMASPYAKFEGMMSGFNGITGAASVATGALGLFSSENEDLQRVMLKVQSLMGITMGLQQVQQTLNKNSAFSLITLNSLKSWWNKILAVGIGEQSADTAVTGANTAAKTINSAATEANTAAKVANNTATAEGVVSEGVDTTAKVANTGAAVGGTAANIGLAGAFRMVGAAIKSIPVFGWIIAAVATLIGVVAHFNTVAGESDKRTKAMQETLSEGRKAYSQSAMEIQDYIRKINAFNGSKAQEKKIVEELNQKYGAAMGYYSSLSQWKTALTNKGKAYCQMLLMEAQAQAILNKYTAAYTSMQEAKDKQSNYNNKSGFGKFWDNLTHLRSGDKKAYQSDIDSAAKEASTWENRYKQLQSQIIKFKAENDLGLHIDPADAKTSVGSGSGDKFDAMSAALKQKEALETWKEAVKKYIKEANEDVSSYNIERMQEGESKEIAQVERDTAKKKSEWENQLKELAEVRKNSFKEIYMAQQGATETGWATSNNGKKTTEGYMKDILSDPSISAEYNRVLNNIVDSGERQKLLIAQKYNEQMINDFGTYEQKKYVIAQEYAAKIAGATSDAEKKRLTLEKNRKIGEVEAHAIKADIDWQQVFGGFGLMLSGQLESTIKNLREYTKTDKFKGSSLEDQKMVYESISALSSKLYTDVKALDLKSIGDKVTKYQQSMKELDAAKSAEITATDNLTDAQDKLKKANDKGAQSEILSAKADVAAAQIVADGASQAVQNATVDAQNAGNDLQESAQNTIDCLNGLSGGLRSMNSGSLVDAQEGIAKFAGALSKAGIGGKVTETIAKVLGQSGFIGQIISAILSILDILKKGLGTIISSLIDSILGAVEGILKNILSGKFFAQIGSSIFNGVRGILNTVSLGIFSSDGNAKAVNKLVETLSNNNKYLQTAIDKLTEEIDKSGGAQTTTYYKSAVDKQKQKNENDRMMLEAEMSYHSAHHSNDYYINDAFSAEDWKKASDYVGKTIQSAADLWKLTPEQLAKLQELPDIWEKLNSGKYDKSEWLKAYIEDSEKLNKLQQQWQDSITDTSFDNIKSSMKDLLADFTKSSKDAIKSVDDFMKNAILKSIVSGTYNEELKKWQKMFAEFMADGTLSSDEASQLRNRYKEIYDEAAKEKDAMLAAAGIDDDSTREGTSKGIATASQDSVDENNARLTTIQGHTYSIVQGIEDLNITANKMLEHVVGIEKNTGRTSDTIDKMNDNVKNIKGSVDEIMTKGIKLKS